MVDEGTGEGITVREAGEHALIRAVTARLGTSALVVVGPGADAAVVTAPDGRVVATTDVLVEGVHFRRDWSSAYDVGRKAAAANLADVAATGAVGTALLIGLVAPGELALGWALRLSDGLRDEAALVGAVVVGGDTVRGGAVVVSVTALGDLQGRAPVTRSGAGPGEVVVHVGRLGWSAAGLALLQAGQRDGDLIEAHRRPVVPYAAGPALADLGATAMCDVSDGLVADAGSLASASCVRVDLLPGLIEPRLAGQPGAGALVLHGGEDHGLLATVPAAALTAVRRLGGRVVGRVLAGSGVTQDGALLTPQGYEHYP